VGIIHFPILGGFIVFAGKEANKDGVFQFSQPEVYEVFAGHP
jgi:hypothetical protein